MNVKRQDYKRKKRLKSTDDKKILVINSIYTDWDNNLNPIIRSIKEVLQFFDYTVLCFKTTITKEEELEVLKLSDEYDAFVQVFETYYFPREFVFEMYMKKNKPIFYYCYDYLSFPQSTWRKFLEDNSVVLTNVDNIKSFNPKDKFTANLNALIYNDNTKMPLSSPFGIIYYGSYRKNREKYFRKYLQKPLIFSTSKRNIEKFGDMVNCDIIEPIDWKNPILKYFKYSLYIEDEYTHKNYNHLASRFYEALNTYTIPVFDENCRNTINLSGYDISDDYIISSMSDIDDLKYNPEYIDKLRNQAKLEKSSVVRSLRDKIVSYL